MTDFNSKSSPSPSPRPPRLFVFVPLNNLFGLGPGPRSHWLRPLPPQGVKWRLCLQCGAKVRGDRRRRVHESTVSQETWRNVKASEAKAAKKKKNHLAQPASHFTSLESWRLEFVCLRISACSWQELAAKTLFLSLFIQLNLFPFCSQDRLGEKQKTNPSSVSDIYWSRACLCGAALRSAARIPAGMWMSQWKQQPGLRISFIFTLAWPHPASMRNSFSPRAGDFSSLRKQEDVPHDWLKDPVIITNVPHRRSSGFASFFPPALTSFLSYWLAVKPLNTSSGGTAWWKTNKLANRKALSSAESLSAKQGGKKMKKRNSQVKKASCCDRKSSLVIITTGGGKSTCILYLLSVNTQVFE